MSKMKDTKDFIRELADLLDNSSLSEIEVEENGLKIRVARAAPAAVQMTAPVMAAPATAAPAAAVPQAAAAPETGGKDDASNHPGAVTSPMVGTAYAAPEPGADPFIKRGDTVEEGQTLLIVEAMKVMNPIPAPKAGVVKDILFSDAQPVEFGEPLLIIE